MTRRLLPWGAGLLIAQTARANPVQETCKQGPAPSQTVTDEQCAPCRNCLTVSTGCGQTYWPCNLADLCKNQLGGNCNTGLNADGGTTAATTLPPATCGIAVRCPSDDVTDAATIATMRRGDPLVGEPVYSETVAENRENVQRVINIFNDAKWRVFTGDQALGSNAFVKCSTNADYDCKTDKAARFNFNKLFPNANKDNGMPASKNEEDTTTSANAVYSWGSFLKGISKYPAMCGNVAKDGSATQYTETQKEVMCKRELATMFAHFGQEVGKHDPTSAAATPANGGVHKARQGLYVFTEGTCFENPQGCQQYRGATCTDTTNWSYEAYPCPTDTNIVYYGRGSKQLSYNYNMGPFSEAMLGDRTILLNDPDIMITAAASKTAKGNAGQPWLAMAGGMFFYMTPKPPYPSMHDLVLGNFVPNAADNAQAGLARAGEIGFGDTINVINGAQECGLGGANEEARAATRITFWNWWVSEFFLDSSGNPELSAGTTVQQGCKDKKQPTGTEGAGSIALYWDNDSSATKRCQVVKWQTGYPVLPTYASNTNYMNCIKKHYGASCNVCYGTACTDKQCGLRGGQANFTGTATTTGSGSGSSATTVAPDTESRVALSFRQSLTGVPTDFCTVGVKGTAFINAQGTALCKALNIATVTCQSKIASLTSACGTRMLEDGDKRELQTTSATVTTQATMQVNQASLALATSLTSSALQAQLATAYAAVSSLSGFNTTVASLTATDQGTVAPAATGAARSSRGAGVDPAAVLVTICSLLMLPYVLGETTFW